MGSHWTEDWTVIGGNSKWVDCIGDLDKLKVINAVKKIIKFFEYGKNGLCILIYRLIFLLVKLSFNIFNKTEAGLANILKDEEFVIGLASIIINSPNFYKQSRLALILNIKG